ncbi:DNA-binding domain-containing protein [Pseudomonas viridiflava]|uniref:HvfC/BufC N-terminal domain-containing protein n=1 Tax=Pseudomonas viridiflava TaxID=33069 RepID=UPI002A69ECA3|nr:DNA-binding domain-containing protein [Pseudomonas viridiflava]MDY0936626.1 DNA-binding domain-containing protein [Pseudomonas viridiflava]MDY1012072.1 DNA-binding domain-containing protein [Pseudomonas viridiflava]
MTSLLADFQDDFAHALKGQVPSSLSHLIQQPGFSVYRNTVMKGISDALIANFPTVERLVGNDWLRAAALAYALESPPVDARLLFYGIDFPDFLDSFEHARQLPYLGNVARLDRLWIDIHCAPDIKSLDLSTLSDLTPKQLQELRLKPGPAAGWRWFDGQPAYTLWRCNREHLDIPDDLQWRSEGALFTRKAGQVVWQPLSLAGYTFLNACAADLPFGQAMKLASDALPDMDPNELLFQLLNADVFISPPDPPAGDFHEHITHRA